MDTNVWNEHTPSIFRVEVTANVMGYIDGLHERAMGGIGRIEHGPDQ